MNKSLDELMEEIRLRVEILEARLSPRLDAMDVSTTTLLPFKALMYREALIWRMTELSRSAFTSFGEDKLVSAILLTRAALETSAILWTLCDKIEAAIAGNAVGDIEDYLNRLILGNKAFKKVWEAINVLTLIERIDKQKEGIKGIYDGLSEFAHPNLAGTVGRYTRWAEEFAVEFAVNIDTHEDHKKFGVGGLNLALAMFDTRYERMTVILPAFTTLCEDHLKAAKPQS